MKKECVILHYLQSVSKLLLSYIDYRQLVYETAQKLDLEVDTPEVGTELLKLHDKI